ncbi:MAG TPA: glycosyltransferase family 2 protein [Gemmatimonadales bacterium]|nr:glycosyltransferase family 2 protein [Gemmatimonadales bacterium]
MTVATPDLTFIMPCYNEEEVIGYTIPRFIAAFRKAGHSLELIAVDNGSHDRTGAILREMMAEYREIVPCRVELNQGYGNGVLAAIPLARGAWVGIIPCDGQVDAEDVVLLYEAARATNGRVVAKVRRRFRMDGLKRKLISTAYQLFVRLLWPRLGTIDVNGSPKILPRDVLTQMRLESKGWLLDPELMVKAQYANLRVLELNVFARMRGAGVSHVRASTCWEFLSVLLGARLTGRWRLSLPAPSPKAPVAAIHPGGRPVR